MSTPEETIVREGREKVERFDRARRDLDASRGRLNDAEVALANATNELGKWITPKDAKPGESFSIWHGGRLYQVTKVKVGLHDYMVEVRR